MPGFGQGDLETGEGLAAAVEGVDVIAHCASAADYGRRGGQHLCDARRWVVGTFPFNPPTTAGS
jgi:hypothetical protein